MNIVHQIMDDVCSVFPSLRHAPVQSVWAGLRPGRTPLRIETEMLSTAAGSTQPVIHNYGHGGSGVTIGMGCAREVVQQHLMPLLLKSRRLLRAKL